MNFRAPKQVYWAPLWTSSQTLVGLVLGRMGVKLLQTPAAGIERFLSLYLGLISAIISAARESKHRQQSPNSNEKRETIECH